LRAAEVSACDLRAGAALVLAGLSIDGQTTVRRAHHLARGYERFDERLRSLGARIETQTDATPVIAVDEPRMTRIFADCDNLQRQHLLLLDPRPFAKSAVN
jgi:hypothetical protein